MDDKLLGIISETYQNASHAYAKIHSEDETDYLSRRLDYIIGWFENIICHKSDIEGYRLLAKMAAELGGLRKELEQTKS